MSGPPRTPTALRRLSGNPGKRGYNPDEPVPPPGTPDCPNHLDGEARADVGPVPTTMYDAAPARNEREIATRRSML